MEPVFLGTFPHDKQAAVFKDQANGLFGGFMFEGKLAFRTKGQGSHDGIIAKHLFPIAVPSHAFAAFMVEIQQAGIKDVAGFSLHYGFKFFQCRRPGKGLLCRARIAVFKGAISVPSYFAFGNVMLAIKHGLIMSPFDVMEQLIEIISGLLLAKDFAIVMYRAIKRQNIGQAVLAK